MKDAQRQAIVTHGRNLQAIFPATAGMDPLTLCRKLRRLEARATRATTAYCNGEIDTEAVDAECTAVLTAVRRILGPGGPDVWINRDPRGYALKIDDSEMRTGGPAGSPIILHRDWGGYGIIAPEITG